MAARGAQYSSACSGRFNGGGASDHWSDASFAAAGGCSVGTGGAACQGAGRLGRRQQQLHRLLRLLPGQPLTGADVQAPKRWCSEGGYFTFTSPNNRNETAELFWRCGGDPSAFTIFLGHGWATSSYDFQHLAALLEPHLYVCSIDYVGAGFSDKPKSPWRYHIDDHAQAVHDFLVWKNLTQLAYYTHDEGSTVGLRLLQRMQDATAKGQPPAYHLVHHFLTDGSIYLPLAHLSKGQLDLLSNVTGPALQKVMFASVLAHNMGHNDFHPGLTAAQITALASVMAYQNGSHIMHETIQYLLLAYYKLFAYRR